MTDYVYLTRSAMVPTEHRTPGGPNHMTLWPGQRVTLEFAAKHSLPYRVTPPPGHQDHIHSGGQA